jgi:anti-sigma regulatory factor (Ser/Thr protein kinase)
MMRRVVFKPWPSVAVAAHARGVNELIESPSDQYRMTLRVGAHSARHIRRIVRAYLRLWGMAELAGAAELGVTELVANVLKHVPDQRCTLVIQRQQEQQGVRVEVSDSSPVLPEPYEPGELAESGRGLALLAMISEAWDAESLLDGRGKTVWFELKC